ncbi:MAG TPA: hypothetical protein VJM33_12655 [Microthrixaceae bacterium]|nr:hypothetical protein [Microthrixaceae bacterium]
MSEPAGQAASLLGSAQRLVAGVGGAVPRLIDRSRAQARFAAAVIERFRCGPNGAAVTATGSVDEGPDAEIVPLRQVPADLTPEPDPKPEPAPASADLAIPDYDGLAASQVLPRLDGLSADELEAVRQHETRHRARRTILGRISQLQS